MEDRNGHLILCDFGLAIPTNHAPCVPIGTACYTAPEIQRPYPVKYTHKSDIWSLGVVLLEMHLRATNAYFASHADYSDEEIMHRVHYATIDVEAISDLQARHLIHWVTFISACI